RSAFTGLNSIGLGRPDQPKQSAEKRPGDADIIETRAGRMADFPTMWDPGASVGQAGEPAAKAIEALIEHIVITVGEELILNYTGGKVLHLLGFLGKKGWKVISGSKGEIVEVITAEGKSATRKEWQAAREAFEKDFASRSGKIAEP